MITHTHSAASIGGSLALWQIGSEAAGPAVAISSGRQFRRAARLFADIAEQVSESSFLGLLEVKSDSDFACFVHPFAPYITNVRPHNEEMMGMPLFLTSVMRYPQEFLGAQLEWTVG